MRPTRHKPKFRIRIRQHGAVLLLVTFSLIALFGLAALALDFGRLYIIESQLQNAADAGALRGAKELDGTAARLVTACNKGVEGALTNRFLLAARELAANDLTVEVSSRPYGASWVTLKTAGGSCSNGGVAGANNLYFMRVTAAASNVPSLLGGVLGIWRNAAKALAVAGRYNVDVAPLAMCALDPTDTTFDPSNNDHTYLGFRRGLSYRMLDINPYGNGSFYWVDPLATTKDCDYTSAEAMRPFLCEGKVSAAVARSAIIYSNSGMSSALFASLDSRFGDYASQGQCSEITAPPDTNVKEYKYIPPDKKEPEDRLWMSTDSTVTQQTARVDKVVDKKTGQVSFTVTADGIAWVYTRHDIAPISGQSVDETKYPQSGTPYSRQIQGPTGKGAPYATPERRLINLFIVRCQYASGNCDPVDRLGIARFLLVTRTDTDNTVNIEFIRNINVGEIEAEIKLYR